MVWSIVVIFFFDGWCFSFFCVFSFLVLIVIVVFFFFDLAVFLFSFAVDLTHPATNRSTTRKAEGLSPVLAPPNQNCAGVSAEGPGTADGGNCCAAYVDDRTMVTAGKRERIDWRRWMIGIRHPRWGKGAERYPRCSRSRFFVHGRTCRRRLDMKIFFPS